MRADGRTDRALGSAAVLHDLNMAAVRRSRSDHGSADGDRAGGTDAEVLDPVRLSAVFATPMCGWRSNGKTAFLSLGR